MYLPKIRLFTRGGGLVGISHEANDKKDLVRDVNHIVKIMGGLIRT
jgi:hypothetical protein